MLMFNLLVQKRYYTEISLFLDHVFLLGAIIIVKFFFPVYLIRYHMIELTADIFHIIM